MAGKWENAMRGIEDVRAVMEEIVEVGSGTAGDAQIVIDACHALEGLDRAEEALVEWREPPEMDLNTEATQQALARLEREGIVGKKRGEHGIEYELSPRAEQMFDEDAE